MASLLRDGRFLGTAVRVNRTNDLVLADVRYPASLRLPRHTHEHPYLCWIRGGTYSERYGRRSRSCGPDMVVYHPAGEHHCQEMHGSEVASFNVEIGGTWQRRMSEIGMPTDQPVQSEGGRPQALAVQIFDEMVHGDADSALVIDNLFWELLTEIHRAPEFGSPGSWPAWLGTAVELLNAEIRKPLSLNAIARECGVHPVHLAATFRRRYGCSVGEHVRRRRVEAARDLLDKPELSLAEIAVDVGFSDQSHFTRTFKRLTGMTPGRYRAFLPFKTP